MSEELKERIHDLLKINVEHQNLNAELRKEIGMNSNASMWILVGIENSVLSNSEKCDCTFQNNLSLANPAKKMLQIIAPKAHSRRKVA